MSIVVLVLIRKIGRGCNALVVQQAADGSAKRNAMVHHRAATGGLTGDGNFGRITTELTDVQFHPGQRKGLVEKAGIDRTALFHLARRKPPECSELKRTVSRFLICRTVGRTDSVLDGHSNEALVISIDDVGHVMATITKAITTLVDVHEHRKIGSASRGVDIQKQAVFVARDERSAGQRGHRLRANRPEVERIFNGRIELGRQHLRRLPSQIACGRGSISDAAQPLYVSIRPTNMSPVNSIQVQASNRGKVRVRDGCDARTLSSSSVPSRSHDIPGIWHSQG